MESPALDLVNSEEWYGRPPDRRTDKLGDHQWVEAFLERWSLQELRQPSAKERVELTELRALLRRLVTAVVDGDRPQQRDLDELDRFASGSAVRRRVTSDGWVVGVDLVPDRVDWQWARSEIAASFAQLLEQGEWLRLKVCANQECLWAFYDETKNRRRRWCGHASCGDLDKVRRFRERQRASRR